MELTLRFPCGMESNHSSSLDNLLLPVCFIWWRMSGSNRRPIACKAIALPAELIPREFIYTNCVRPVGYPHPASRPSATHPPFSFLT